MNNKVLSKLFFWGGLISLIFLLAFLADYSNTMNNRAVRFSVPSGFYDDEFFLTMESDKGTKIYYTLDSSEPDQQSLPYCGPILIEDASKHENTYCMRTDVSVRFEENPLVVSGQVGSLGYETPVNLIDKATVVKAIAVNSAGEKSETAEAVYFIGFDKKRGYSDVNIISISTDPENLFGYDKGIYVLGKQFDLSWRNADRLEDFNPNIDWWKANYTQRGLEWERPAHICFFDTSGQLNLEGNYGIRIQGNSSRGRNPKSINIFARDKYGSSSIDGETIFGCNWKLGSVNLNAGGHDENTLLKEYLFHSFSGGLKIFSKPMEPYILFLDGEYWGFYWLSPRNEKEYFNEAYGVKKSNIVEIKNRLVEIGKTEDIELYNELIEFVSEHDLSKPDDYIDISKRIDIQNSIDYYATELYLANVDWPHNNYALWRSRSADKGKDYSDCRWRWIVYDVDITMQSQYSISFLLKQAESYDPIFSALMENEEYRAELFKKLTYLATYNFNPRIVEEYINDYEIKMADTMANEFNRFFGNNKPLSMFFEGCKDIKMFFRERYDYIMETYKEYK